MSKKTAEISGYQDGSWRYLIVMSLIASLGGLLFGFDTAVISGTFASVRSQFHLTGLQEGWFGSSALVGCIIGAVITGSLSDAFGRKRAMIVSGVFFFVSAVLTAVTPDFTWLVIGRMIGGVGVGMASGLVPTYLSEFAPARYRGRLVACYQLAIVIGILTAFLSNYLLIRLASYLTQENLGIHQGLFHKIFIGEIWRAMFGAEILPAGLFMVLLLLVPESPRWLIARDRFDEALHILGRINGHSTAVTESAAIKDSLKQDGHSSWQMLFSPGMLKVTLIVMSLSFFGQLTGVNVVFYYGPKILEHAGFEKETASMCVVFLGFINLVFTLIALWKMDSWGRRPLLLGGMAVVTLTMVLSALLCWMEAHPLFLVVTLAVYVASIALSICAVIWVLTPELLPNRIRGVAVSIATFTNWSCNAFSAFVFPWYAETYGMHTAFATFSLICFIGTLVFLRFIPETKGKTLEEIETMW